MARGSRSRFRRPVKCSGGLISRKLQKVLSDELGELLAQNGPWAVGWSLDDLNRRSYLLNLLGNPETFLVEWVSEELGETYFLGDVANLLPGPVPDDPVSGPLH